MRADTDQGTPIGAAVALRCIFIGGCPRSGTTMLGSALGAASGAVVTPESQFKIRLVEQADHEDPSPERLYDEVKRDRKFIATWHQPPAHRVLTKASDPMGTVRRVVADIVDQYAERIGRKPWTYWIDHSPENLRFSSAYSRLSPDTKFIHLVRDGRAVAASVLPLDWGPTDAMTAGKWWVQEVAHGLAAQLAFPNRTMMVRYEDLVAEPAAVLQRICEFTRLTFNPEMVKANALVTPRYVKDTHHLVGSAISPGQVSAWRDKLSKRQVELFEFEAGNLLDILGYGRTTRLADCRPTAVERLLAKTSSPAWRLLNQWRNRTRIEEAIRTEVGDNRKAPAQ